MAARPVTTPAGNGVVNNYSLNSIITKINGGKPLTVSEAAYYTRMRAKMPGLPAAPASTIPNNSIPNYGSASSANSPVAAAQSVNQSDRGADPAFQAANSAPAPGTDDRGSDPSFQAANPDPFTALTNWASQRNTAVGAASNPTQSTNDPFGLGALAKNIGTAVSGVAAAQPAADQSGAANGISMVTHLPDEQMPNIPNVTLAWHDFTPQAQQKVAGAYAPLYQAINQGKTNATAQEKNSAQVVSGLYNNLATQRAGDAAKTAASYDANAKASKASDDAMVAGVQGAGNSATTQLAQIMAQAGLGDGRQGTAAADELSASLGGNSAAVQQAKTQAGSDASNIAAQKQNQLDYSTNSGQAEQRQGEAAQEGLQNQLTTALQGYDQQTLSTKADQAQQGLTLAQQMSQNDWTAQTGSADQTWNHYNAAMSQAQAKVAQDQANAGLMNQAAGAQASAQTAANQLAEQQAEFNANYNLQTGKMTLDAANQQAIAAAKAKVDAAKTENDKTTATAALINAYANANKQQGTNPNAVGYNPLMDPTSPQYLAAHNPQTLYNNTVLGVVAGGKTDKASTDLAQSYMTLADTVHDDLAREGASQGNPKIASMQFKAKFMQQAAQKGLDAGAAAQVADAWLKEHPEAIG